MLTPEDIRNPARKSGFNFVSRPGDAGPRGGGNSQHQWRARFGRNPDVNGPRRATPEEAAQDYCDYVNGQQAAPAIRATLKSAGHARRPARSQHPKRVEAARLLREADADEAADDDGSGYVYCIGEKHRLYAVKVGKSKDHPRFRLGGLQTGNPRHLEVLGFLETDDRHALEDRLHAKYAEDNILGEWFCPNPALLSEFNVSAAVQLAA